MRLGLALSGGGLRATLFHLGVIRYLSESDLLREVKYVTSVSGGSILAAHLVLNWTDYLDPSKFNEAARELIAFAGMDVRGRILRRLPTHFPLAYFDRTRLRRSRATRNLLLESFLTSHLYRDITLRKARERQEGVPRLDILATNLTRGTLAYFMDDHFIPDEKRSDRVATEVSLAKAVAISAAFPGFFPPIELDNEALGVDNEDFPTTEYMTDGGVYDNLGLRRFRTLLTSPEPPVDHVLVCDASGHFDWVNSREEPLGLLKTALRSTEIFMKRLAELESEVFYVDGETRFTHLQISDAVKPAPAHDRVSLSLTEQQLLKNVRTDLDFFSATEIDALDRHGYAIAAGRCGFPGGTGRPVSPAVAVSPLSEKARIKALKASRFRRLRFFSLRDRISYVHLLVVTLALVVPGARFFSTFIRERFISSLHEYRRDTFGQFELKSADEAARLLDEVETAQQRWPRDSAIQADVALAAYSIFNSVSQEHERSFNLLARALTSLRGIPKLPREAEKTYYQLQGHYLLAEGERRRVAGKPAAARAKYLAALESYQQFRRLTFRGLHALEFNLCNTARMVDRLDYALERCEVADRYARESHLNFWPPKAIAGRIYAAKGDLKRAATTFHEAWEIAARVSTMEEHRLKGFLAWDVKQYPSLCKEASFQEDLTDVCAAASPVPPAKVLTRKNGAPENESSTGG
jgi:predicted acylesterase/phospholipase RssA